MAIDTIVYEGNSQVSRLAGIASGRAAEIEFVNHRQAAEGNVYLAKIVRKIDLANDKVGYFVDILDSKPGFINAWEPGLDELKTAEGQSLVVQVAQEQRAEKGAKLTRNLQFAGKNLVYCPYKMNVEVSSKIEDKAKADEYREWVVEHMTGQEGWILRTSSVSASKDEIAKEMEELRGEYENLRKKARSESAPCLLAAKGNPLWEMVIRNQSHLKKFVTNSRQILEEAKETLGDGVEFELENAPFDCYGLDDQIAEAMLPEVKLPGGGRLFIEETKACVAIDVDSGDDKARGALSHLNEEAAEEIVRQIRLRNLAGKIIIDFAGASDFRYLNPVVELLEKAFKGDYIKTAVYGLSRGGNVEIVRSRRRPSLKDVLSETCPTCHGSGRVEK